MSLAATKEKGKKSAPILQCKLTQLLSSARNLQPPINSSLLMQAMRATPESGKEGGGKRKKRDGLRVPEETPPPTTKVARNKAAPTICPSGPRGQEKQKEKRKRENPSQGPACPWQGGGRAERPEQPALTREALGGAEGRLLNKKYK